MAEYRLWFFVEGKDVYHNIIISQGCDVADLKAKIHKVGRHDYWIGAGVIGLVLFQVDIDPTPHEGKIPLGKRKVEDEMECGKSPKLARTELHKPDTSGFSSTSGKTSRASEAQALIIYQ
ncbi:hypothetical protein EDB85DRAFT_1886265 [Lactarius pseudohatsudake]|nr:hypothetical protein EDB85DRAFT_1886265 [Lactarius pseudohatsudake]